MDHPAHDDRPTGLPALSRCAVLQKAALAGVALTGGLRPPALSLASISAPAPTGADPTPHAPIPPLFAALQRYPLVAIAERHFLQEWHDFIHTLLLHPDLPPMLTDIVVEFGNAGYQDLADRFILKNRPVARADLANIWRYLGWDAPVYEQFFRTVRALNWMRPPTRRIRVLLGTAPFDVPRVRSAADAGFRHWLYHQVDTHYTTVVEREVLAKGRRALLIAGGGHLLRGLQSLDEAALPNVGGRLAQRHPGALYVVDTLAVRPGPARKGEDVTTQRLRTTTARWPRPALATLAGTWLGAAHSDASNRALSPSAAHYAAQADAVLYLGPGEILTASQADPTLFQCGTYRANLERLNPFISRIFGRSVDLVAASLRQAQAGPQWWAQFD